MVWPERDGVGWRAWVSVSGAYPGLSETRSCTAADKFVSSDPDQSYYQFWSRPKPLPTWLCCCGPTWPDACLIAPHTDAAVFDGLDCWVRVCGVSCWIPQEESMSFVISSIKLCLHVLCLFYSCIQLGVFPKQINWSTKPTFSVAHISMNMFMHTHFYKSFLLC